MSPSDIVSLDRIQEIPENDAILLEKGHNTYEIVHVAKDGKEIQVEVNNHLINYEGKKVCLAVSRDTTDRKKVEEKLKSSLEEKDVLLRDSSSG